jgi:hypothetical protein
VKESADQEIISAVHARALAAQLMALVGTITATASTAGTLASPKASVPQGHIRAVNVHLPVLDRTLAAPINAMESTAQMVSRDFVRSTCIGDVPVSRPAVLVIVTLVGVATITVLASTCPEMPMETFSMDFAPQALTGDACVNPFVVLATVPALILSVKGSTLPMAQMEFVPMATIWDVCVTRFAKTMQHHYAGTVEGRTQFAPPGILLAANVLEEVLIVLLAAVLRGRHFGVERRARSGAGFIYIR